MFANISNTVVLVDPGRRIILCFKFVTFSSVAITLTFCLCCYVTLCDIKLLRFLLLNTESFRDRGFLLSVANGPSVLRLFILKFFSQTTKIWNRKYGFVFLYFLRLVCVPFCHFLFPPVSPFHLSCRSIPISSLSNEYFPQFSSWYL